MGGTRSQLCKSHDSALHSGTSAWSDGLQVLSFTKHAVLVTSTLVFPLSCDLLEDQNSVLFIFAFTLTSIFVSIQ